MPVFEADNEPAQTQTENRAVPVDGDKTALVDSYATAVVNDEGRTASGYSAAAKPIQHKVSDLSMTLERQSHIVSCNAVTAWLFHMVNSCFAWTPFQSCAVFVGVFHS